MAKYRVEMSAPATVSTVVEVEADTEAQAEESAIALARQGDVIWNYEGADDHAIEIWDIDQIGAASVTRADQAS